MRIIDADGHVLERDIPWPELIDPPFRNRAPRVVQDNRGFNFVMIDGKLTPKPVGKGCSFVGAPRSHHPQQTTGMVDPKQRLPKSPASMARSAPGTLRTRPPFTSSVPAVVACEATISPGWRLPAPAPRASDVG